MTEQRNEPKWLELWQELTQNSKKDEKEVNK